MLVVPGVSVAVGGEKYTEEQKADNPIVSEEFF